MSESDFFDFDLTAFDLDSVSYVVRIDTAKAEILLAAHPCENPNHARPAIENLLMLIVTDDKGKTIPLIFHPESEVAADILSCNFCERLKLVAQTC